MMLSIGAAALCFLLVISVISLSAGDGNIELDRQALVHFMENADLERVLVFNWTGSDPCAARWSGVGCKLISGTNRVSRLELESKGLTGGVPLGTVGNLVELRVLSLKGNALKGRVPSDLSKCTNLQKLYLNLNLFDGPIPDTLSTLHRLDKLVLANNRLTGTIPESLLKLKELLTLRLEVNLLTGRLPDFSNLSKLQDFNVSWNRLSGGVPAGMANRDLETFAGNNLCGQPVSVNCSNKDVGTTTTTTTTTGKSHKSHPSKQVIAIIIISCCTGLVAILLAVFCCYKCRGSSGEKSSNKRSLVEKSSNRSLVPSDVVQVEVLKKPCASADLVFVRKEERDLFELDELLHAPAQLLGKGSLGSTYKTVFAGGLEVAVKRLVDRTECSQKLFERRMKIVGKLTHPNLLPLKAYHFYAKLEKLLVYDYMPRGSLHSLLHANEALSGNNALTWSMRLEIAQGVAKCLRFLHHQCKLVHGNIKSSNVLLTDKYEARVCDFGLLPFIAADVKPSSYWPPESGSSTDLNRRADVYSYGILLLELLTGKVPQADTTTRRRNEDDLPSWVIAAANEQAWSYEQDMDVMKRELIMGLFKIALLCISRQPERRPDMNQVVEMIEDINLVVRSPDYSIIHSLY